MLDNKGISKAVINRMPRYYRYLGSLMEQGIVRISSAALMARSGKSVVLLDADLGLRSQDLYLGVAAETPPR